MNRFRCSLFVALAVCALSGCYSARSVSRAPVGDLLNEGTVAFVRPSQYTMWFGTHSPREYFEVTYERFSQNDAGLPVVEVGIRYRGGQSWTDWYRKMPQTVTLGAVCSFYDSENGAAGGPVRYSTNRERIVFRLGETCAYRAVCPVRSARGYQLVLGE